MCVFRVRAFIVIYLKWKKLSGQWFLCVLGGKGKKGHERLRVFCNKLLFVMHVLSLRLGNPLGSSNQTIRIHGKEIFEFLCRTRDGGVRWTRQGSKLRRDLECFACKFTEQHKYEINKLRRGVIVTFLNPHQKSSWRLQHRQQRPPRLPAP